MNILMLIVMIVFRNGFPKYSVLILYKIRNLLKVRNWKISYF